MHVAHTHNAAVGMIKPEAEMSDCEKSDKNSRASSPNAENNRYRSTSRSRSRSPVRSRSRSKSPRRRRITVNSKRVYVCNIPYEMKWMEIKDIFKKEVGEAPYVDMMETVDGKPKGACLLEFKDKETARKAIEKMHRYKVKDRQIVVREEKESDRQMMQQMKNQQQQHSMGAGLAGPGPMGMGGMGNCGAGGGSGGGGAAGPSPQLLQNLGIEGPLTNTVFVANLDYKVTWKKLKDVFKLAGNVLRAEIKQDKDGKSRGMGIVTFEHPMEAVQAISMFNSQTLYDRAMVVRMDKTSVDTSNDKTSHPKVNLPSGLKSIGMGLGLGGQPMQNFNNQMSGGGGPMGGGFGGSGGGGSGSNYGGMGAMGSGMGGMGNMGGGPMNNYSGMSGMGGGMDNMGGGMGGNMGGMSGGMNTGMGTGMSGMAGNMSGGMLPGNMGGMSGMAGMSGATNMGSGAGGMGGGMGSNMGSGMGGGGMGSNMTTGSMGAMGMSSGMSGGGSMGGMGGGGGMGDGYGMGANNLGPKNFGSNQGMNDTFSSNMSGMGGLGSMGGMMGSMGNQGMNMSDMSGHGLSGMDGRSMMKNMSSSGSGGGGGGGGGGSSGRDDCHIVVRNLPHSFTWQMLRERFRDVGDVKYAEIKTDGGKSRGWGVVRFATPEDAQRAVNLMNRARIEGREIECYVTSKDLIPSSNRD